MFIETHYVVVQVRGRYAALVLHVDDMPNEGRLWEAPVVAQIEVKELFTLFDEV